MRVLRAATIMKVYLFATQTIIQSIQPLKLFLEKYQTFNGSIKSPYLPVVADFVVAAVELYTSVDMATEESRKQYCCEIQSPPLRVKNHETCAIHISPVSSISVWSYNAKNPAVYKIFFRQGVLTKGKNWVKMKKDNGSQKELRINFIFLKRYAFDKIHH